MNTLFALLAKYGDTNIPPEKRCRDYFGMEVKKANERGWIAAPLLHRLRPDQALLGILLQILQRSRILSYCVS